MAKNKPRTDNSRAARRAMSPSLNVDKSLTSLPRAESPGAQRPSVLTDRRNSGIQKKQKQKKMSRAQRMRHQKGMDRAEAVMDQMEIKKERSFTRAKVVKDRRGEWEDLNKKAGMFAALQQTNAADDDDDDDDDDDEMSENTKQPKSIPNPFASETSVSEPVADEHAPVDEEDDIT
ncbi:uncharacterized protein N7443_002613 [Penicillium atrosanguineum]|uniref:uncharacterized protein n=1 Tax=Penicillium atrosanguineum TaxID=1132637 RepID=UPI0023A046E9|nr:uncharacterized protein N7443_002613 [Penicillium atrosanguineum]KAJ5310152.1 hypothetical protein N7443_002613 [Penicillium atrosanguineum]